MLRATVLFRDGGQSRRGSDRRFQGRLFRALERDISSTAVICHEKDGSGLNFSGMRIRAWIGLLKVSAKLFENGRVAGSHERD
jgi:hypothetical protein